MKTILLLYILLALPASAQDYQPLTPGNFWTYLLDDGTHQVRVVGEMVSLFGNMVFPLGHPEMDSYQNLVNYWSTGPDGDLLLWGWSRGNGGYYYLPPIVLVDSPLALGKSWSTTVDVYAVSDSSFVSADEFSFAVYDHADITVPAGTFESWGVGYGTSSKKNFIEGRYNLMGEEIGAEVSAGTGDVESWYAEGVGLVQHNLSTVHRLEDYSGRLVANKATTWGGIKAIFR